jgi:hypothetical protein
MKSTVFVALASFVDCVRPGHGVASTARVAKRSVERLAQRLLPVLA